MHGIHGPALENAFVQQVHRRLRFQLSSAVRLITSPSSKSLPRHTNRINSMIPLIAFRLRHFSHPGLTTNFTFTEALYITLTQTQVNYSIISATIPNLRPVINNLNTHYGAMGESTLTGSGSGSTPNSNGSNSRTTGAQSPRRRSRRHSSLSNVFAMGPLKRFASKAKDSAYAANGSGNREVWDEMTGLETVPSIGTQAVETGSSVRVHGGLLDEGAHGATYGGFREAEEGRLSLAIERAPSAPSGDVESVMSLAESQKMIIRKDVEVRVQSDGR